MKLRGGLRRGVIVNDCEMRIPGGSASANVRREEKKEEQIGGRGKGNREVHHKEISERKGNER